MITPMFAFFSRLSKHLYVVSGFDRHLPLFQISLKEMSLKDRFSVYNLFTFMRGFLIMCLSKRCYMNV